MADLPEVVENLIRILSLEQFRHIRILQGTGPGDGGHPARYPFRGKCARGSGTKSASGNSAIAARVSSRLAECVSCWRSRKCYILASEGKRGMCYIIASASWGAASSESGKLGGFSEIIWTHLKLTEKKRNGSLWRMGTVQRYQTYMIPYRTYCPNLCWYSMEPTTVQVTKLRRIFPDYSRKRLRKYPEVTSTIKSIKKIINEENVFWLDERLGQVYITVA